MLLRGSANLLKTTCPELGNVSARVSVTGDPRSFLPVSSIWLERLPPGSVGGGSVGVGLGSTIICYMREYIIFSSEYSIVYLQNGHIYKIFEVV